MTLYAQFLATVAAAPGGFRVGRHGDFTNERGDILELFDDAARLTLHTGPIFYAYTPTSLKELLHNLYDPAENDPPFFALS